MQIMIWFAVGCVVGMVGAWLVGNVRAHGMRVESAGLRNAIEEKEQRLKATEEELKSERAAGKTAGEALARAQERLEATGEKIQALQDVEKNLKESFEVLAGKALDSNSQRLIFLARKQNQSLAVGIQSLPRKHFEALFQVLLNVLQRLNLLTRCLQSFLRPGKRLACSFACRTLALQLFFCRLQTLLLFLYRIAESRRFHTHSMGAYIANQPCPHHAYNTPNREPDHDLHATNLRQFFANPKILTCSSVWITQPE